MKWFFDNNLAPGLAEAVAPVLQVMLGRGADRTVHLRDRFAPNAKDIEWLPSLKPTGDWIIVSGDADISRVPAERKAWLESGHLAFFLASGWTHLPPNIQLSKLAIVLPEMVKIAERERPPAGYLVPVKSNKLRRIYP